MIHDTNETSLKFEIYQKIQLYPSKTYFQGMDHAEFPDYVSDIAKNLILTLCR